MFYNNACFTELLATSFYWLPGFSNKINAPRCSIVESCSIVNQNILKSKVKGAVRQIEKAPMNDHLRVSKVS